MPKGVLFVVSAPSGAGKSTLISAVRPLFPDIRYSVSCTTRAPRKGETEGADYFFVTRDEFEGMVQANRFLEWKEVHGNLYGTPAGPIEEAVSQNQQIILDIDVQGAEEVFSRMPKAAGIFIMAPSIAVLERRLRARGTDSEETIQKRLRNAGREIQQADLFQFKIVNDNLRRAVEEFASIIRSFGSDD
jgi:guanylate kinase